MSLIYPIIQDDVKIKLIFVLVSLYPRWMKGHTVRWLGFTVCDIIRRKNYYVLFTQRVSNDADSANS